MSPLRCLKLLEVVESLALSVMLPPFLPSSPTLKVQSPLYTAHIHLNMVQHMVIGPLPQMTSTRRRVDYVLDLIQQIPCVELIRDYPLK